MPTEKSGLYANVHAKQERIAQGSKETMRKPGEAGAPGKDDFDKAAKTETAAPVKKAAPRKAAPRKAAPESAAKKSAKNSS